MNQKEKISLTYISTGCNKSPQAMDWGENNLVCFGACKSVAIYDPNLGKIMTTFTKHKDTVTCVRWIRGTQNRKHQLISGAADSALIFWTFDYNNKCLNSTFVELSGHKSSILAVDGICKEDSSGIIIVSAAADNTFRFWGRTGMDCGFICHKEINTALNFILCLNLLFIPNDNSVLLAMGTDTPDLLLYSLQESDVTYLTKTSGHEDWIRSVDMIALSDGDILIASSGQDMMIRILRLSTKNNEHSTDPFSLKNEEICIKNSKYFLTLETVLFGHEGWVYSVSWLLSSDQKNPKLLSASFDRTLIIWKPCPDSGVWLEESRMGEMGGDNTLGYYGAKFGSGGLSVLAHSYQGGFHFWKKKDCKWIAEYVAGGHFDAVTDIAWEKKGRYIISVSTDKTTRIHSPCLNGMPFEESIWCEVSRPQIHGHALYSVTSLNGLGFASCSEEKVVRAFLPTYTVLKILKHFCDPFFNNESEDNMCSLPSSASITALGLSNKANVVGSEENVDKEIIIREISDCISLNEDYLVQNTLWPEVMKLYGHGNDVFCLSSSHDGKILATAAKATTPDQAKIILWDTEQWDMIQKLDGHQLTVTQMAFSPDSSYLLSVSRDRKWCLFKKCEDGLYSLSLTPQKGRVSHSRIVWSCSWSHDGKYFVTGSRDCKAIIWELDNPVSVLTSEYGSVTAVSFGPTFIDNDKYILAIGHESGHISIYTWLSDNWMLFSHFSTDLNHHLTVQRLLFQPITPDQVEAKHNATLCLASCSADYSVRLYTIYI